MVTTKKRVRPTIVKAPQMTVKVSEGLFEEYKTLRSEILQTQGQRMQIISLTVGAVGGLLTITVQGVLSSTSIPSDKTLPVVVGVAVAIYAILIPSLIMMVSTQKGIQRIGGYIRLFIEPKVPGLHWEGFWHEVRSERSGQGLYALGVIYYFLSVLPLLLPLYAFFQDPQRRWYMLIVLIPFVVWALYLTHDLWSGVSKDWKRARLEDDAELRK